MNEKNINSTDFYNIAKEILARKLNLRFQARGFSMSPFIKDGDVLVASPLKGGKIGFGRVVAAIRPGTEELIVHRIVGKIKGGYLIKGDNTPGAAGLFPEGNVLGYVAKIERNGKLRFLGLGVERYAVAFLNRTKILSYILCFLRRIKRGNNKEV